ncbi:TPA: glycoside hydrolase family 28 protein [Raoultella planticola]
MAILNILDFGADPQARQLATSAIQQTIDSAGTGDTILIPAGRFLSGALFLKSDVTFHLAKDALLLGSQNLADYPLVTTRVAGIDMPWPAGIINIHRCQNVQISGTGTIDGQGAIWWEAFWGRDGRGGMLQTYAAQGLRWVVDYDCQRPRNLVVYESDTILLQDFTSRESGFWNLHLCYSRRLRVQNLTIANSAGPSTDGIDVDSCEQVLIEGCTVSCNDDNICVKAGRGKAAALKGRASRDVVIRHCTLLRGSGITLGSETSGGIERITIEQNRFRGTGVGFRIKSARNRGGFIRDITVRHLDLLDVAFPLMIQLNWFPLYSYGARDDLTDAPAHWRDLAGGVDGEAGLTRVSAIEISDISARRGQQEGFSRAFFIEGYPEQAIDGLTLSAIDIDATEFGKIAGVKRLRFDQVTVNAPTLTQTENDTYER